MTWSRTRRCLAAKKAAETVHVQLNESNGAVQVVNNTAAPLTGLKVQVTMYGLNSRVGGKRVIEVPEVPASTTVKAAQMDVRGASAPVLFCEAGSDGRGRAAGVDELLLAERGAG